MTVEEGRRAKKERVPFLSHFSLRWVGITIGLSSFFLFCFFELYLRARKIFLDLRCARFSASIEESLLSLVLSLAIFGDLSSLFTNEK